MYVLRCYLRTGLNFDYLFEDIGTATAAFDGVRTCRLDPQPIQISDDAGRTGGFDGKDVLAESLLDIDAEARSLVRLGLAISNANEIERRRLGIVASSPGQNSWSPPPSAEFGEQRFPPPPVERQNRGRGALNDLLPPEDVDHLPEPMPRFSS